MTHRSLRRLSGRTPVVAVALAVALLAACGAGDDDSSDGVASLDGEAADTPSEGTAATETTAPVDTEQALLDFAACMRENGVDMPDPQLDENGGVQIEIGGEQPQPGQGPPEGVEEAMEACEELMPRRAIGADGEEFDPTEMQDQILEFTQCMRDQGIDMPDPDFGEDGDFVSGPATDSADVGDGEDPPTGRVLRGPFGTLDLSDPETGAAFDLCSEETGMFGPDGGGMAVGAAPVEADE